MLANMPSVAYPLSVFQTDESDPRLMIAASSLVVLVTFLPFCNVVKDGGDKGNSCCCHHEQNEGIFSLVFLLIVSFVNVILIIVVDANMEPRGALIFLSCSRFIGGFGILLRNTIR